MIVIINNVNNLRVFPSFVNITFIVILKFVLEFLNLAIKFDFINDVIINKFIIILKFILKFSDLAVGFDFIDDIVIGKIKGVIFIKERSWLLKYCINLKLN